MFVEADENENNVVELWGTPGILQNTHDAPTAEDDVPCSGQRREQGKSHLKVSDKCPFHDHDPS